MIAYYTPPFAGVGQFRINKFIKYISNSEEISKLTVISVSNEAYTDICNNEIHIAKNVYVYKTAYSKLLGNIFNEEGLIWAPYLVPKLIKELKNEDYDSIYINGNPFFHIPICIVICKIFKVKVIVDYRDPWLLSPYRSMSTLKRVIISFLENFVVKNCRYLINVTKQATDIHVNHYSKVDRDKFITIENGFDIDDFHQVATNKTGALDIVNIVGNRQIIVYSGKFSDFRNPKNFLNALRAHTDKYFFLHIGGEERHITDQIKELHLEDSYFCTGYLAYSEAISIMKKSHFGLIISGGHPYEPTTKVFDYIALNLKKIVITDNNDHGFLYDTLNNDGASFICKNNIPDIHNALSNIHNLKQQNQSLYSRFNRQKQAESLLSFLK
ncbi:hypothetical protein C9I90_12240 [Photobacterium aphoticum]|nr:hypothetical protein C9I90_12240 [Photobacterium aphoticum]